MSKPLPLAKPPHPLKSLPASKPNEKKRCTVPQSECEPGNPMPKVSRKREPTMSSSDSDAHSSPKQSKGYEFSGISYPTYSEMVAAKRERNRKVLDRTLSEISSVVDKKSLSSLKGDDSAASRSNKKNGRRRSRGKKEARGRSPVRRNPRRVASANESYTDDGSVGSKSTLSSRSSSSNSAANESAESEDSEDITPAKVTHPPSEVGVKKRGAKRKRVASPPVSVRRNEEKRIRGPDADNLLPPADVRKRAAGKKFTIDFISYFDTVGNLIYYCPGVAPRRDNEQPTKITSTGRKSQYRWVWWRKKNSKFFAQLTYNNTKYKLGMFFLATDAALAVDNSIQVFLAPTNPTQQLNFPSKECYEQARALELEETGQRVEDVGSIDDIQSRIQKRIADIQNPKEKNKSKYYSVVYDPNKKRFRATIHMFDSNFNIGEIFFVVILLLHDLKSHHH
jgi:hypothetical protein